MGAYRGRATGRPATTQPLPRALELNARTLAEPAHRFWPPRYVCHDDAVLRRFDEYNPFLTQADRASLEKRKECATDGTDGTVA